MPFNAPYSAPPPLAPEDGGGGEVGVAAVPNIGGVALAALLDSTEDYALVRLADNARARIPASDPLYAVALELPEEAIPPVVPTRVTNAQARAALRAAGLIATVEAAIAAADPVVADAWNHSPYISRASTLVSTLGTALGLDAGEIDALFIAAAQVEF